MKEEDKNSKSRLSDLLRYNSDNLSGREKNSIEKEFQKDPFAEEAAEGLSFLEKDQAIADIDAMKRSISKKASARRHIIWYRIAASIAVLMALSSIYFLIDKERRSKTEAELAYNNPVKQKIEEQAAPLPITPLHETVKTERAEPAETRKKAPDKVEALLSKAAKKDNEIPIAAVSAERIQLQPVPDTSINARSEAPEAKAPSWELVKEKPSLVRISGRVISADDNSPVPGAIISVKNSNQGAMTDINGKFSINVEDQEKPVLVASYIGMESKEFKAEADTGVNVILTPSTVGLSEVIVTGYGVARKNADTEYGYVPPEPVGGRKEFDSYIEENMRKIDSVPSDKKRLVVIRFTVSGSAAIKNIRIIKTPGEAYSVEAKRLILEGPGWLPAKRDGITIDGDVTFRITFK